MTIEQKIIIIEPGVIISKSAEYKNKGYRLVQISCTALKDRIELSYSFGKGYTLENLRINLPDKKEVPSISGVYWSAFLYENEIHDLFGVKITGIAIDYKGNFYKTTVKTPFAKSE
jgi:ech hydrogenase subunit D